MFFVAMDNAKIARPTTEDLIGDTCRRSSSSIFARWLKDMKPTELSKYNTIPTVSKPWQDGPQMGNHASLFQKLFAYRLDSYPKHRPTSVVSQPIYNESGNVAEATPSSTSEDRAATIIRIKNIPIHHPEPQEQPSTSEPENRESDRSVDLDKYCEVLPNLESPAYLHLKSMMDDSLARVQCQMGIVKESEKFILCSMTKYLRNESTIIELSTNFQHHVSVMLNAHIENARTEQEMLKEQIDSHRIQTTHYKELITSLTNQLRELRKENADLDGRNEKIKHSGDQNDAQMNEMVHRNEDLRKKIKELRDYVGTMQSALAELTAMVQSLQERNRKLETDNEYLKVWIERIDHDYTNQMDHMTRLVDANVSHDPILALNTLSMELGTLNSTINTRLVDQDVNSQKELRNMIFNICEMSHATVKKLNDEIARKDRLPGIAEENLSDEDETRRNKEIITNTNDKMQSLLKILSEYEKKAKQWEKEKELIEEQFKKEKEEHAEFLKSVSKRIDKLTQENEQLKELKCQSSSMLQNSKGALDQAQEYLNEQLKRIGELEDTVTDITRENNRLTLVAVYNKQLCEQLRSTIKNRDEAIEQLRNGMQQCSVQLSEDNAEKIALCGEVEQLSEEKLALTDVIERLKEQTKKKLRQNDSDKKALQELSLQYKNVVMERDGLYDERLHLLNQVESLKQRAARQKIKCENQVTTCYQLNMKVAELTEAQQKLVKNNASVTFKFDSSITGSQDRITNDGGSMEAVEFPCKSPSHGSELRCSCAIKSTKDATRRLRGGVQQLCRCRSDTPEPGCSAHSSVSRPPPPTENRKKDCDTTCRDTYVQCCSRDLELLRGERNKLKSELEGVQSEVRELQDEFNDCTKEKQSMIDQLAAQKQLVADLTGKNCEMACKMKVTQSNNEHLMRELCQKDIRFNELKKEYRKFADKAEADQKRLLAEISELLETVKNRDTEIKALIKELKVKNQAVLDLDAKLVNFDFARDQVVNLQNQIDKMNCERRKILDEQENEHLLQIDKLRKEHADAYNRYIETVRELTDQQAAGREALEQAQQALTRLEQKHVHLGERIVGCVRLLVDEKMKTCDSEARRKEMTKWTRMLESEMEGLDRHNSALLSECNDARRRMDELMEVQRSTHQLLMREQQEHQMTKHKLVCMRSEMQVRPRNELTQDTHSKMHIATACEMERRLSEAQVQATTYEIFQCRTDQLKTNLFEKQSEILQLKAQISDLQNEALKVNFTVSQQKLEILRLQGMVKTEQISSEDTCCSD